MVNRHRHIQIGKLGGSKNRYRDDNNKSTKCKNKKKLFVWRTDNYKCNKFVTNLDKINFEKNNINGGYKFIV